MNAHAGLQSLPRMRRARPVAPAHLHWRGLSTAEAARTRAVLRGAMRLALCPPETVAKALAAGPARARQLARDVLDARLRVPAVQPGRVEGASSERERTEVKVAIRSLVETGYLAPRDVAPLLALPHADRADRIRDIVGAAIARGFEAAASALPAGHIPMEPFQITACVALADDGFCSSAGGGNHVEGVHEGLALRLEVNASPNTAVPSALAPHIATLAKLFNRRIGVFYLQASDADDMNWEFLDDIRQFVAGGMSRPEAIARVAEDQCDEEWLAALDAEVLEWTAAAAHPTPVSTPAVAAWLDTARGILQAGQGARRFRGAYHEYASVSPVFGLYPGEVSVEGADERLNSLASEGDCVGLLVPAGCATRGWIEAAVQHLCLANGFFAHVQNAPR